MSGAGGRAQAFHCPYCGEEELRPADPPATHHCPACDRRFALRLVGMGSGVPAHGDEPRGGDAPGAEGGGRA